MMSDKNDDTEEKKLECYMVNGLVGGAAIVAAITFAVILGIQLALGIEIIMDDIAANTLFDGSSN